jgi:hypothetical protein
MPEQSYLEFLERTSPDRLTLRWEVRARRSRVYLGRVAWHARLSRYVFAPSSETTFDAATLTEMAAFLAAQSQIQQDTARRRREAGEPR